MAIRRFGPVLGAGVQVEEKEGVKQILPAPLGVSTMIGEYQRGPVGEPGFPSGVLDYKKRYGSRRLPNSEAPGAVLDFYSLGQGAGEVIPYRVTAGDENQSIINLYNRKGIVAGDDSGRGLLGTLKAKNGGQWGGQRDIYIDEPVDLSVDLTATTLDTGATLIENEWANGTLQIKKVTSKTYKIISNTALGVISVEADQDLLADYNAGSGTPAERYVLTKENVDYLGDEQHLAVKIKDGEENPTTEFAIEIYEDGALVKAWNNLNTDPTKANYWVNVINDDKSNYWVVAADLYTGDKTVASVMPSNYYGISSALAATVLTLPDPDISVSSVASPDPAFVVVYGSLVVSQTITGVVSNTGADIDWTTTAGPLAVKSVGFTGVPEDLGDELLTITVTNGATPLVDGDIITIVVNVLKVDEAKGGTVWPDRVNEPNLSFIIDSNTRTTVSVRAGLDLTNSAAISAGEEFALSYNQQMVEGHNGSPISDSDYLPAFDPNLSKLNRLFGKNKGLVKITTPGVVSTAITKDGLEYAAARNYQYLVEFPVGILTEADAIDHINTTIGRSDYGFCYFPSWGSVLDPNSTPGTGDVPLLQVSLSGMILGRHALVARNYDGYHKAPADTTVTLPSILELPTGDAESEDALNEELLNPKGINVIKFRQGTVIVWGDRTISPTSEWQWLHQRSLMSHYENILRENFDWIIFALNDVTAQERLSTTLRAYFLPEWTKGALRGDTFNDAFSLKMDEENNNDLTRSQGDLNAEMLFRLADTVERFKMVVGKQGIFDAVE